MYAFAFFMIIATSKKRSKNLNRSCPSQISPNQIQKDIKYTKPRKISRVGSDKIKLYDDFFLVSNVPYGIHVFKNHDDFILIKYEDFLSDKEKSIKQLAKKLNLDIKKDITHLLDYNFQPKGKKKSIKKIDFFGKENLDLITKLCEKNVVNVEDSK